MDNNKRYNPEDDVFDIEENAAEDSCDGEEESKSEAKPRRITAVDICFFIFMLLLAFSAFFVSLRKDAFSGFVYETGSSTPPEIVTTLIVNINTATKEELMELDGIGEVLAERIIDYREENGGFKDIREIVDIEGISENTFDKIYLSITV